MFISNILLKFSSPSQSSIWIQSTASNSPVSNYFSYNHVQIFQKLFSYMLKLSPKCFKRHVSLCSQRTSSRPQSYVQTVARLCTFMWKILSQKLKNLKIKYSTKETNIINYRLLTASAIDYECKKHNRKGTQNWFQNFKSNYCLEKQVFNSCMVVF